MATTDTSFRLYYPGGKAGSFGTLAGGFKVGFEGLGIKHALCDYRESPDEDGFGRAGSGYDIGLYVGDPSHLSVIAMHTSHKERLVMVAPNGLGIPEHVVKDCKKFGCTVIAPSKWAASVMEPALGYRPEVLGHGVHLPSGMSIEEMRDSDRLRLLLAEAVETGDRKIKLLHVTSTATDRKGTRSLLKTFHLADLHERFRLTIKTDPIAAISIRPLVADFPDRIRDAVYVDTENYPNDGALFRYYREHDLVVQPSAAEGFGLCGLEAACAGVPSVLTWSTGHRDFCTDIVSVPWPFYREPAFIPGEDFDGYPPVVDAEPLLTAGCNLVGLTKAAAYRRRVVASTWSWPTMIESWLFERSKADGSLP